MFRSFIYLDEDKLYSYMRLIQGKNTAQPTAIAHKKHTEVGATLRGVAVNHSVETDVTENITQDICFDYDQFELALNGLGGEDYFDCVVNDGYDITTIPAMNIARICAGFEIPEEFDAVKLIEMFKPMLMGQIETKNIGEQAALQGFLGNASADIPIIIDYNDITLASKLNAKYLQEDYSLLEDYMDQDVYILFKTVGMVRKESVEIFDPLKDFIRLPRTMRRQMTAGGKSIGIDKISVDGPVLKAEIIAIYK